MDSGNSGSMQSSSTGGDEEYDSRADSISAFLNNPPNSHVGSLPNPHHPQPPAASTQLFDQLSNYFDPIQRSPSLTNPQNSLLNLDMGWSKPFRSDPNSTDLSVLIPSSPTQLNQAFFGQTRGTAAFPAIQQMHPLPAIQESGGGSRGLLSNDQTQNNTSTSTNTNNNNTNTNPNVVRNPKKRSRASRRAPTTVLTTDTTNFRAMVQEFTGIPAPPFTSFPFPRSRLDLFGTAGASSLRSTHSLDPRPPNYLLRPFAQKFHPLPNSSSSSSAPSFLTPSLVSDAIASNSLTATTNSTSTNYQLSSSTNPLNMNMLNFQSFLQSPHPKQGPPNLENLKMGHHVLEEFGLSSNHHGTGNLNSGLEIDQSNEALSSGTNNDGNGIGDHHHQQLLRSSLNGNTNFGGGSVNGKVNYSGPSSDFHGDRGPECLAAGTRNEGMMESWINCSSD